jgi:hypothetical protein
MEITTISDQYIRPPLKKKSPSARRVGSAEPFLNFYFENREVHPDEATGAGTKINPSRSPILTLGKHPCFR